MDIPDDHPRAQSLKIRHRIIEGMHAKIVAEAGLIAHGRGEAFDYLIGEKTHGFAIDAIKAAAASLFMAKNPVLSVNGNVTVLCPDDMVKFSNQTKIPLEINLFYRSDERIKAITNTLSKYSPFSLLGNDSEYFDEFDEISSARRIVDKRGILIADVVFVPLEDGDRTIGLKKNGKTVITVDLNPLSRTSLESDITIVDNIIRVFPLLLKEYRSMDKNAAEYILNNYNNKEILKRAMQEITIGFKNKLE